MNKIPPNTPASGPVTACTPKRVSRICAGLVLIAVAVLTAYSIFVATLEPDPQETLILGQARIASSCSSALRILVRNRISGRPVQHAKVTINLMRKGSLIAKLGSFQTDAEGSLAEPIQIPDVTPGEYQLVVEATSSLGSDHVARQVQIHRPARILLSSDKPLYQPGQTIHLRSLVANGRTQRPLTNEAVTFEIRDPKGNKVFKETRQSSGFGIASADFVLATELNVGRYEIRAKAAAASSERTVEVKKYVLPKFKIRISTDKGYYLPGEWVSGSVAVEYFFGKPASDAMVKLTASTFQEKQAAITNLQGWTDTNGSYSFRFELPDFFVGLPQKNEQAFLDLEAEVRDSANHVEKKTLSLSVAQHELEVTAIPEAGVLVPGVENLLYILTAYPDGRPATCKISINGSVHQANEQGLCEARVTPVSFDQKFQIQAIDEAGKNRTLSYSSQTNLGPPAFLLRTDKAIYRAGETAQIGITSTEKHQTIFIDAIRDGQTILTKSVPLQNHKATYAFPLPPDLVGTLTLNAYFITGAGEDRGCSRIIHVKPASGLQISSKLSQQVFRPGEVARLDLSVTDADGRPAPAALGIAAVDESAFALQENRPGLLKQFIDSESDLLKPRYQIKFFDSPSQILVSDNQPLAAAYFGSVTGAEKVMTVEDWVNNGYVPRRLIEQVQNLRDTPAYQKFRADPQYAELFPLLEGNRGLYSLRELTGPLKLRAAASHREAYFRKLKRSFQVGFLGLLFLSPVLLLIYHLRAGTAIHSREWQERDSALYVKVAGSIHNTIAALILLPLVCYPVGILALERFTDQIGWILLSFETAVVLVTFFIQHQRTATRAGAPPVPELAALRVFMGAFFAQFTVLRAAIVVAILFLPDGEGFAILLFIASFVAPLMVLGTLNSNIHRQLSAKGIKANIARFTVVEALIVISILAIFAAMLLPALAKAKARAQSIVLLNDLKQLALANQMAEEERGNPATVNASTPHVRRDFPETLFWQPEIITDDRGKASLEIPMADSITTWQAAVDCVNSVGRMGSTEIPITVFQDFFVDLDLPASMSLGDEVSVPVTCYNYLKETQRVQFTMAAEKWYETPMPEQSLSLGPNEVKSVNFPMKVLQAGTHPLRVTARGTKMADAIEREVRVAPTGDRREYTKNAVLKDSFCDAITIPSEAIADSQSLWARFYPSRFSEVIEGLEGVFKAPYGCFEQTSSTTYPNVLVLDYMKRMGRLTPEIEIKARKFINAGYQRLLTFEVVGGGFEGFGRSPANICLTAYGILEFTDMARIHPVDEDVAKRARKWLFAKQNNDGSWAETHRGWTWSDRGSITAFIAWALAESGDQSPNLGKALVYLQNHPEELSTMYGKALAANAFLARNPDDPFGHELASQIKDAAIATDGQTIHWTSGGYSITYSHDSGMEAECTALCAMALMKEGKWPQSVKQAMTWISNHKFADGTHGSTQATILSMRALLEASSTALGQEFESIITVLANGETVETFHINKENSDVLKQVDLTRLIRPGDNRIQFSQTPSGELPFALVGEYWLPSGEKPAPAANRPEPLQISLEYDRATLPVNDLLHCAVTVKNNESRVVNMAIVDLGIPPGFDVDSTAFESLLQREQIEKFEITGNEVILYLRELSNTKPFKFDYALRARYPLRVQTSSSSVYEYYQPQNRAGSKPVTLKAVAK